jgi:multiple antibiotic resistance protein
MLYKPFHELATLIVVVKPIGVVPLFIDIAGQESTAARQRIGERAVIIAAVILLAFIAIKQILPDALGVDLASFRIADGLVLVIIGLRGARRAAQRRHAQFGS